MANSRTRRKKVTRSHGISFPESELELYTWLKEQDNISVTVRTALKEYRAKLEGQGTGAAPTLEAMAQEISDIKAMLRSGCVTVQAEPVDNQEVQDIMEEYEVGL